MVRSGSVDGRVCILSQNDSTRTHHVRSALQREVNELARRAIAVVVAARAAPNDDIETA